MLIGLADYLAQYYSGFHVFHYITLRAILAVLTALLLSLCLGPALIRYLSRLKMGQTVRAEGPETHLIKAGTPTMGGALILIAIFASTLLWAKLDNHFIWVALFVLLSFGLIGWIDDYKKIVHRSSDGLAAKWKYFLQSLAAIVAAVWLYSLSQSPVETTLILPFIKSFSYDMGIFYVVLTYFVIVGTSNAVNLTDGLDGLAIVPTVLVASALAIFIYVAGHHEFARYLAVPYVHGAGELTVICATVVGAGLGFLWFNTYPAAVFMGDVGSLALGALLGVIAVIARQEFVLFIMGGIFVVETLSVILQVGSYKLRGKRIFRMAPLHHHFELAGWPEPKVIVRFWIITVVLVLIGLSTLKIR